MRIMIVGTLTNDQERQIGTEHIIGLKVEVPVLQSKHGYKELLEHLQEDAFLRGLAIIFAEMPTQAWAALLQAENIRAWNNATTVANGEGEYKSTPVMGVAAFDKNGGFIQVE